MQKNDTIVGHATLTKAAGSSDELALLPAARVELPINHISSESFDREPGLLKEMDTSKNLAVLIGL